MVVRKFTMRVILPIIALEFYVKASMACSREYPQSDKTFIHNNDTLSLELDDNIQGSLRGEIGSRHNLSIILKTPRSEDNFPPMEVKISGGWQIGGAAEEPKINPATVNFNKYRRETKITISDIIIPNDAKVGGQLPFRIIADCAEGCNDWGDMHASYKRQIQRRVLFTVIGQEFKEKEVSQPSIDFERNYKSCGEKVTECENEFWEVGFKTTHPEGLRTIEDGNKGNNKDVRFWYKNFDIGTDEQQEFRARATCCTTELRMQSKGMNSNLQSVTIKSDGSSDGNITTSSWYSLVIMMACMTVFYKIY